jgi:xanthine dehydrogenase accessory factor
MRDVMEKVDAWLAEGQEVMLATVVKVWGSAPRPLGSHLAQSSGGGIAGSVSGGCVEGAVLEEGLTLLEEGGSKLLSYGVEDELAFNVGLSCGGQIEVFCERLEREQYAEIRHELENDRLAAIATVIAGPHQGRRVLLRSEGTLTPLPPSPEDGRGGRTIKGRGYPPPVSLSEYEGGPEGGTPSRIGSPPSPSAERGAAGRGPEPSFLGEPALDPLAERLFGEQMASFEARRESLEIDGVTHELFLEILAPRPVLIVVGAVHVAIPLVSIANLLGFKTIVVDPRTAFATRERFRHADDLLHEWPDEALRHVGIHRNTFVALLSHDPKLDVPAARVALAGKARYVGALGSKKTHQKRVEKLREAGVPEAQIARLHNPIGLDLGGRKAQEIAVAVIAEIVAVSHGIGAKAAD